MKDISWVKGESSWIHHSYLACPGQLEGHSQSSYTKLFCHLLSKKAFKQQQRQEGPWGSHGISRPLCVLLKEKDMCTCSGSTREGSLQGTKHTQHQGVSQES